MSTPSTSSAGEIVTLRCQVAELTKENKLMKLREARHEKERASWAEEKDGLQDQIDILQMQASNIQATEDDAIAKAEILSENEYLRRRLEESEIKIAQQEDKQQSVEEGLVRFKANMTKIKESKAKLEVAEEKHLEELWKSALPKDKGKRAIQETEADKENPASPTSVASIPQTAPITPSATALVPSASSNTLGVPFSSSAWSEPKAGILGTKKQFEPKTPFFRPSNFPIRPTLVSKGSPKELPTELQSPRFKGESLPGSYANTQPRKDTDSDKTQAGKVKSEPTKAENSKGFGQGPTFAQIIANPFQPESEDKMMQRKYKELTLRRRAERAAQAHSAELSSAELTPRSDISTETRTEKRKSEGFGQGPTLAQIIANPPQPESKNEEERRIFLEIVRENRAERAARERSTQLSSTELKSRSEVSTETRTEKRKSEPEDMSITDSDSSHKKRKIG